MKLSTAMRIIALVGATTIAVNSASAFGLYVRKGKDQVKVFKKGGKLYCKRQSDGFEMCNGMTKQGNAWKGKRMKHPDMPGFMTFNGTVVIKKSSLSIKGCAVGNSMCRGEVWKKK